MPKVTSPTSFTAGRTLTLNGTTYTPGQTIPNATVKSLKNLSALLGNRDIIPNVDPHSRKTRLSTPTPTDLTPGVRAGIS